MGPGECSVQFLKEPMFNTALIIGYYWIPLCILITLYAQIFHKVCQNIYAWDNDKGSFEVKVIFINSYCTFKAWSLSKKSSDKEKERSKLLSALAKKPTISGQASVKKVIF